MSDTTQTIGAPSREQDLDARSESFEVSPALVASSLSFGGSEVPEEMMSAVERIWQDESFTWPTTIAVTAISVSTEGKGSSRRSISRVSVVGTGFDPDRPVELSWGNAAGFPDSTVALPTVKPTRKGFFGAELVVSTVPRRAADFTWDAESQLALIARQSDGSGTVTHTAEQRQLPPHALWHWVR